MPDNDFSEDVKQQADEAAVPLQNAMSAPTSGESISQPVPDAPADVSQVPDPYDVQGQEGYRAEQRAEAVAARDAAPEIEAQAPEQTVSTPVGDLSQSDNDAALKAGLTIRDAMDEKTVTTSPPDTPDTPPDSAPPAQDIALDPKPEPQAPDMDRE